MIAAPKLLAWFEDYASYHRTEGNQVSHLIGIPAIVVTLLGLLSRVGGWETPLFPMDLGILIWAGGFVFYFVLDWRLSLSLGPALLGCYFIGRAMPGEWLWAGFIGGWVAQFIGHYRYEKKSPAFYKNLEHLLIGPAWVFCKITGLTRSSTKWGARQ